MKRWVVIGFLFLLVGITACSNTTNESNQKDSQTNESVTDEKEKSDVSYEKAEDVVNLLKKSEELPIGEINVYSADNDPNELLGRPGGYTSKADFLDANVEKKAIETAVEEGSNEAEVKQSIRESFGVENGGSVEVFETNEDAEKRKEYIETITKEMGGLLTEYSYVKKNVLLRLSKSLTHDHAAVYETVLKETIK